MPFNLTLPNGETLVGVPDGTTKADIVGKLQGKGFQVPQEWLPVSPAVQQEQDIQSEPSFLEKMQSDFSKRQNNMAQLSAMAEKENVSAPRAFAQQAGEGFGLMNDAIGNAVGSAYKTVVPESDQKDISRLLESIGSGAKAIGLDQAAKHVGSKYNEYAPEGSPLRADLNSAGNYLGAITAVPAEMIAGKAVVKAVPEIASIGKNSLKEIGQTALDSAGKDQVNFLKELITPKKTENVKKDMFGNSRESGFLRGTEYLPSKKEVNIASSISDLPVSSTNSLLKNYNIIDDAARTEASRIKDFLVNNDVNIPDDTIINGLYDVNKKLSKNLYLKGQDGSSIGSGIMDAAIEAMHNNPSTASGVFQARKDFDAWVLAQRGEKAFDPKLENAIDVAVDEIRTKMNQMVSEAVPDANLSDSLFKQHNMISALERIKTKGASHSGNAITRSVKAIVDKIPGDTVGAKGLATALGVGSLAASAPATIGVAATYGLYKGATSQAVKKSVGKALGGAVKMTSKERLEADFAKKKAESISRTKKGKK